MTVAVTAGAAGGIGAGLARFAACRGMTGYEYALPAPDAAQVGENWIFPYMNSPEPGFSARNRQIVERTPPQFFLLDQDV